ATFTCDLHASSTPPTFVLSQDQTLHLECCSTQCLADSPIARLADRLGTACAVPTRSLTRSTSRPPGMPKISPQGALPRRRARKGSDLPTPVKIARGKPWLRARNARPPPAGRP